MNILEEFTGRKIITRNDALIRKIFGKFLKDMKLSPEIKKVEKLLRLDWKSFNKRWRETIRLISNNEQIGEDLEIATILYEREIDKIIFCERDLRYCRAFYVVVVRKILGADLRVL